MKKPFKETKVFSLLKIAGNIAMDVLPFPDIRNYFDKNQDGKINPTDLSSIKCFELTTAIAACAFLVYFDIVSISELMTIIKTLLNLN